MNSYHTPVLLKEIIDYLDIGTKSKVIDATLGGGGHTQGFLEKGALVLGIDQDEDALKRVSEELQKKYKDQLITAKGNFKDLKMIAMNNNFTKPDAILFDLGVSSHQINTPDRGFSFQREGVLDMRMDQDLKVSALEVVNKYSKDELVRILSRYGEEHLALPIAVEIIKERKLTPITSTEELKNIVADVYLKHGQKKHHNPATKTFQALRIEVNDELNALKKGLLEAIDLLNVGGRLAVISYHSLEDRICKLTLFDKRLKHITKKPVCPTVEEVSINPRARSAKLRVSVKL